MYDDSIRVCPGCGMIYPNTPDDDGDVCCPNCGWEYEYAKRNVARKLSVDEQRALEHAFPVDLSSEVFFIDDEEFRYDQVDVLTFYTSSSTILTGGGTTRVGSFNTWNNRDVSLTITYGGRKFKLTCSTSDLSPNNAKSQRELSIEQAYRTIAERSYNNRMAAAVLRLKTDRVVRFGRMRVSHAGVRIGFRTLAVNKYIFRAIDGHLAALDRMASRPAPVIYSSVPNVDVAATMLTAIQQAAESR